MKAKKLTTLALSVALAMILSFVESQIPPLSAVPGVKIGLPNIVTVFLLYTFGVKEAGGVSLIRVVLSSLLFGSFVSLIYSLSGAVISLLAMLLAKRLRIFSTVGVSVIGGVLHNAAQVLAACLVMENAAISLWIFPLIISGTLAGVAVGAISGLLVSRLVGKLG